MLTTSYQPALLLPRPLLGVASMLSRYRVDVHFEDGSVECFNVPGHSPDTVLHIMEIVKEEQKRFSPEESPIVRVSEVIKIEHQ